MVDVDACLGRRGARREGGGGCDTVRSEWQQPVAINIINCDIPGTRYDI